jgi:HSP20 family protein
MEGFAMLPIVRKRSNMPNLVDEFFGKDFMSGLFDDWTGITSPAVNIVETADDFRIEVAAPGLGKDDFKIDLDNNVMTISSQKEEKKEVKDEKFMRREFSYSSFKRSFGLPEAVDRERIKAFHENGILKISLPKREEAKDKPPREIKIV